MTPTREAGAARTFSTFTPKARERLWMGQDTVTGKNHRPCLGSGCNSGEGARGPWSVVRGSARPGTEDGPATLRGFTLLELMMVMTLILILASLAVPSFHVAVVRAREAVLRDDLYTMRKLIDQFTMDKQRAPVTLDELVEA